MSVSFLFGVWNRNRISWCLKGRVQIFFCHLLFLLHHCSGSTKNKVQQKRWSYKSVYLLRRLLHNAFKTVPRRLHHHQKTRRTIFLLQFELDQDCSILERPIAHAKRSIEVECQPVFCTHNEFVPQSARKLSRLVDFVNFTLEFFVSL